MSEKPLLTHPFKFKVLAVLWLLRRFVTGGEVKFGLLRHTERRSGRAYVTPLRVYLFGDGFVLELTYGPDVVRCRNVMATGKGILRWHGQKYVLEQPENLPATLALASIPCPSSLP